MDSVFSKTFNDRREEAVDGPAGRCPKDQDDQHPCLPVNYAFFETMQQSLILRRLPFFFANISAQSPYGELSLCLGYATCVVREVW